MKKIFCLTFLVLLLVSGCGTEVVTGVFFGPWDGGFGGANLFFISDTDRSTLTQQDIQLINNLKESAKQSGYDITDYSTPERIRFKASAYIDKNNDIPEIPGFITKPGARLVTVKNINGKNYYKMRVLVNLSSMNNYNSTQYKPDLSSKINYKLNLPVAAKYNNADKVLNNGKILEWSLVPGEKNLIKVDFEAKK